VTDRLRAELIPLLPAVVLVALWMIWIPATGGFYPDAWYPSTLGVGALALVTVLLGRKRLPSARAARVALLAFLALVALNYLSILWSASPGSALQASNQLVLYAAVAWTFAILPWTPRAAAALLGAWAIGVAVFCAIGLIQATTASLLDPFFVSERYATPLLYPNATGALAVMGMWPAMIFSSRRELPVWLRAAFLGIAVFLAEFSLLPQSRGALVGLIITTPIALAVASDRLRLLSRMLIIGGGLAISVPRTVAVDDAVNAGHHVAPVLEHAANGMLLTSVGALLIGALLALAENRWGKAVSPQAAHGLDQAPPVKRSRLRLGRGGSFAAAAAVILLLAAATVAAAPRITHYVDTASRRYLSTGSTRIFSTTPEQRVDYARVALHLFVHAPILGVGAGNFGRHYDGLRHFDLHSQYTHNLTLRVMSETGIIGLALFIVVIGAITVGLVARIRANLGLIRACCAAALLVVAYFLVHASFDWLDEYPVLAAPALALPMAALALGQRRVDTEPTPANSRLRVQLARLRSHRLARVGAHVAALAVGAALYVALSGSYLSNRYVERAFATYQQRPTAALNDLRSAEKLNPLSVDPITAEGTISLYLAQPARARAAFVRAIARQNDWYPWLELALLDAEEGRFATASKDLDTAAVLDVDDPLIATARTMIHHHQRIDPIAFNMQLLQGPQAFLFQKQNIK
jgi:hypothetical protein